MAKRSRARGAHFAPSDQPKPESRSRKRPAPKHNQASHNGFVPHTTPSAVTATAGHGVTRNGFVPQTTPRVQQAPRQRSKTPVAIAVLVVVAVLTAGVIVFWRHRPVSIQVGGQQRTVLRLSTYNDLYASESPQVTPGNLVSVTKEVLEEGKGNPYVVTVNGVLLSYDECATAPIWGGESIEFGNGDDVLEPHTTEVGDLAPKLRYKVAEGTGEKGYMVQQGTVQYVAQWGKSGRQEVLHGQTTGQTGPGKVVEEAQDVVVVAQDIHPDNDQKLVALTFDDGPSYYTESYLRILEEYGAKASFCVIGEQLADGGPVVAEVHDAGNQILSHSWSHLQLTTLGADELAHELGDTAASLEEWTGTPVRFVRPPYGDIDEQVWLKSGGSICASVFWTHDSLDWEKPGVDAIVENCTKYMRPGSVILMHDGGGERDQDLEALPRIIKAWQDAGYTFVTVEELMASDSSIPMDAVRAGTMPADAVWPTELASDDAA